MKRRPVHMSMVVSLGLGLTLAVVGWLSSPGSELPSAYAAELRVCASGCPYASIQAAVDAANAGDVIKVAAGSYTGVSARAGVTQVVYISKTITLRGGYTTTNWTTPFPITQPTTLDAQGQAGVMSIIGDISPTIEGLHITGGAHYFTSLDDYGGGIWVMSATATIRGNRVFENSSGPVCGGGLRLGYSNAVVEGNWVYSNTSIIGGGVCLWHSDATLIGNSVSGNTASFRGGGLHLTYSDATLTGNRISGNEVSRYATFTPNGGGGLYIISSTATLVENIVVANTAINLGGGLHLRGSAATLNGNLILSNSVTSPSGLGLGGGLNLASSPATLNANVIARNTADIGGGMSAGGSVTLTSNTIVSNVAVSTRSGLSIGGGGLRLLGGDSMLVNNVIADNQASIPGSGVYVAGSSLRLLHNTIARNRGGDGGGVHISSYISPSAVTFTNTIFVSHTVGITVEIGNTATLAATLWGTSTWANLANWGGAGAIFTGTLNVFGDPAFVNPDAGDYHMGATSAARNAGVDAAIFTDVDNQPRLQAPDLGADEYWPPGTPRYIYLPVVLRQSP